MMLGQRIIVWTLLVVAVSGQGLPARLRERAPVERAPVERAPVERATTKHPTTTERATTEGVQEGPQGERGNVGREGPVRPVRPVRPEAVERKCPRTKLWPREEAFKEDKLDEKIKEKWTYQMKIVNGQPAAPGEYPYQAQLLYNGNHRCGGSIVHSCYVLTARHCVQGVTQSALTVVLGEHDLNDNDAFRTEHQVARMILHPTIDVALLLITPSADLTNPRIGLIELASVAPTLGDSSVVTGWGWTVSGNSNSLATVLQELTIPIASPAVCNLDVPGTLQAHEICAGDPSGPYSNACHGDWGGPLVVDINTTPRQVGIVSWGNGGCPSNHIYAVYVSVASIRPWVMQYLPSIQPCPGEDCRCINPAVKHDGSLAPASWDGAHCLIGPARAGCQDAKEEGKGFIYQNRYYIKSHEATLCPQGTFDTCNCYLESKPPLGFIQNDVFYYQPATPCPAGTTYDGTGCKMYAAPWATDAFIYNSNFYTTARKQCVELYDFGFDGANCLYDETPGPNPFIYNNAFYSDKIGANCPAGSWWDSAHCYFRHAPWATNAFLWQGKFYSTARKRCIEGSFDGANCLVMTPPVGATISIYQGNVYYGY